MILSFLFISLSRHWQMHYNITAEDDPNAEADLHTYMSNPEVFTVQDGHINVLEGQSHFLSVLRTIE